MLIVIVVSVIALIIFVIVILIIDIISDVILESRLSAAALRKSTQVCHDRTCWNRGYSQRI